MSNKNTLLLLTGILLLSYGLTCVLLLTREGVNNMDELKQIASVFNISQIIGWIIIGVLTLLFMVSLFFPPLKMALIPFQAVLAIIFLISFVLSIMNTIFYKKVTDENPDYGRNVTGKDDIQDAIKDSFVKSGMLLVIIGSACLTSYFNSVLSK